MEVDRYDADKHDKALWWFITIGLVVSLSILVLSSLILGYVFFALIRWLMRRK